MNEKEKLPEFDLEDIVREFSTAPVSDPEPEQIPQAQENREETASAAVPGETIRIALPVREKSPVDMAQTIRLPDLSKTQPVKTPDLSATQPVRLPDMADTQQVPVQDTADTQPVPAPDMADTQQVPVQHRADARPAREPKAEPYSEGWQPEFEQPIADYVPPRQILLHPRSRLQELKRKLVAGPEKRYYELGEIGTGKLQTAIFLSVVVVLLSACATAMYALELVVESRMKLMVFGQFLAMLLSAALGSYQLMEGVADIFRKRFSLNSLLVFTFLACCADGIFCLQQTRIPCCAAFSLQVTMSLWSTYHRRTTEMNQMDTLRKAVRLNSLVKEDDYYDGTAALLRTEGKPEDFMDHYQAPSKAEKVLSVYAVVALLVSVGIGITAGVLWKSVSFGVQLMAVSLLAAVPVTSFITQSRPMCLLEKRLHKVGAVLCGWQGIRGLSGRLVFPLQYTDLFPGDACKLNGVKFYGSRDPDQVVAYCAAVICTEGGLLAPLFEHLLNSRNGRHYTPHNFRAYEDGGVGAEVCTEPVLLGSLPFLHKMGVEIPEGISVNNAVYAAIDGELCGVFAVTYAKDRVAAAALHTLCTYRGLQPVLTTSDFILTESFIRSRFGVNTRRIAFPDRETCLQMAAKTPDEMATGLAISTKEGVLPFVYAAAGARALRTASNLGTVIHMMGGILGLIIMLILAVLGVAELLTPVNMLLYELVWLVPGFLITEWTRSL